MLQYFAMFESLCQHAVLYTLHQYVKKYLKNRPLLWKLYFYKKVFIKTGPSTIIVEYIKKSPFFLFIKYTTAINGMHLLHICCELYLNLLTLDVSWIGQLYKRIVLQSWNFTTINQHKTLNSFQGINCFKQFLIKYSKIPELTQICYFTRTL